MSRLRDERTVLVRLTESVRARLNAVSGVCPACHGPGMSHRKIAEEAGVDPAAVWRFLKGKPITSTNLDTIEAWVTAQEARAAKTRAGAGKEK